MLTVGIFPNTKKQSVRTVLGWMIQYLKERQVKVIMPEEAAQEMGYPQLGCCEKLFRESSVVLTLGGDGTLLHTARTVAVAGIPICGINMGRLGFLTEVELPELEDMLEKIIAGNYHIEERLMLESMVMNESQTQYICPALNDVVVTKGGLSRLIRLNLYIDGHLTAQYPADGIVISTSTGSTGYSLSAGGPIVNPSLNVMVITPICPHILDARPLIISEKEEIKITIEGIDTDIVLTADGQNIHCLTPNDIVVVKSAPYRAKFIRFSGKNYYAKLYTKLRRGDRNA